MSPERRHLFGQVEKINLAWIESMREMRRSEAEFSVHLFSCKTAEEALALCEQWLERREKIQADEKARFNEAWINLKALLAHSPKALQRSHRADSAESTEEPF